jgi:methionyl-tRNA formyltransferase
MFDMLARAGAPLMIQTLAGLADGSVRPRPQNHSFATFAPLLDREDGRMDFTSRTATELHNRWRGFQPWPGAFTGLGGKKLIVHRMAAAVEPASTGATLVEPGRICVEEHRLYVACAANTWLELVEVQLEGKKRLPAAEFLRGAGASVGPATRLG